MDTTNDTRRFDGPARTARRHHHFPAPSPAGIQPAYAISNTSAGDPTPPGTDFLAIQPDPPLSATNSPRADLLYCTDVEPRRVEWLWQGRLAAGSLAVISGNPGSGKTWVALAIAAALSNGHSPGQITTPHAGDMPPCTTLYASTHHLASELVRPRFVGLGGDPARLVLLKSSRPSNVPPRATARASSPCAAPKPILASSGTKNTFNGAWYWELPQSHSPPVHPD